MTTTQLSSRHNYSMRHTYRLMRELRKEKLIFTDSIRGYTTNRSRQGDYHRITGKGIRYLNTQGIKTDFKAEELRVSTNYLPYVLSLTDLSMSLSPYDWVVKDSREVKREHNLNFSDRIDGSLESPLGIEYATYIFINPYSPMNLKQVRGEVERNTNFQNILILAKSKEAFGQVFNEFNSYTHILQYKSFKVLPFDFGCDYLSVFHDETKVYDYLSSYGVDILEQDSKRQYGLPIVVEHEGEEKYLVNMLSNDLTHLHSILNYRRERYERDGRKILFASNLPLIYKEFLSDIHHIDYLDIDQSDLRGYISYEQGMMSVV